MMEARPVHGRNTLYCLAPSSVLEQYVNHASCFPVLVQNTIGYMSQSTVSYKMGFVLDYFIWLEANIHALSLFKVD